MLANGLSIYLIPESLMRYAVYGYHTCLRFEFFFFRMILYPYIKSGKQKLIFCADALQADKSCGQKVASRLTLKPTM